MKHFTPLLARVSIIALAMGSSAALAGSHEEGHDHKGHGKKMHDKMKERHAGAPKTRSEAIEKSKNRLEKLEGMSDDEWKENKQERMEKRKEKHEKMKEHRQERRDNLTEKITEKVKEKAAQ